MGKTFRGGSTRWDGFIGMMSLNPDASLFLLEISSVPLLGPHILRAPWSSERNKIFISVLSILSSFAAVRWQLSRSSAFSRWIRQEDRPLLLL